MYKVKSDDSDSIIERFNHAFKLGKKMEQYRGSVGLVCFHLIVGIAEYNIWDHWGETLIFTI